MKFIFGVILSAALSLFPMVSHAKGPGDVIISEPSIQI